MNARRTIVYANTKSSRCKELLELAVPRLREGLGPVVVERDVAPADLLDLTKEQNEPAERIVVAGGDGTLNKAAEALIDAGLPVGMLPVGTANDFARTLGIPPVIEEACDVIIRGHTRCVDVARVNGRYFFNGASIGIGVEVTRHLTRREKTLLGAGAYVVGLARALRSRRPFSVSIRWAEQSARMRCVHVAVGNGRYYGGGLTMSEAAAVDDGLLNVHAVKPQSLWRLVTSPIHTLKGQWREIDDLFHVASARIEVETDPPLSISADGELFGKTPAQFDIAPSCLTFYVPDQPKKGFVQS